MWLLLRLHRRSQVRASESRLIKAIAPDELSDWHETREKCAKMIQTKWRSWKKQALSPRDGSHVVGLTERIPEDISSDDASEKYHDNGFRDSQQRALHLQLSQDKRKLYMSMVGRKVGDYCTIDPCHGAFLQFDVLSYW